MTRYRYLDILRGVATLGILPANLPLLAMPIFLTWRDGDGFADSLGFHATTALVEHKFLTLFCVLFGTGIYLFRERAERRGERSLRLMVRRLGGILLFGIAHVGLLWFGDILWYYAVLGLLVTFCFRWSLRWMTGVAVGLLCVTPILLAISAIHAPPAGDSSGPSPEKIAAQVALVHAPLDEFIAGIDYPAPEFETRLYLEGGYVRTVIYRVGLNVIHAPMMLFFMGTRILGLMLLGMALAKGRWFQEPVKHVLRFRKLTFYGLGLGALLSLIAFVTTWVSDSGLAVFVSDLSFYLATLSLATGYAGTIGLLFASPKGSRWLHPFEAVGRMALTNYIGQSVIGATLFYSYGFGLYGSLHRGQLWLVAFAVWAVLLVASTLWMRRFRQGPLERALRWMTYEKKPDVHPGRGAADALASEFRDSRM